MELARARRETRLAAKAKHRDVNILLGPASTPNTRKTEGQLQTTGGVTQLSESRAESQGGAFPSRIRRVSDADRILQSAGNGVQSEAKLATVASESGLPRQVRALPASAEEPLFACSTVLFAQPQEQAAVSAEPISRQTMIMIPHTLPEVWPSPDQTHGDALDNLNAIVEPAIPHFDPSEGHQGPLQDPDLSLAGLEEHHPQAMNFIGEVLLLPPGLAEMQATETSWQDRYEQSEA